MAIQKHKLNVELSKEVLENCKGKIKKKECYNNIFNVTREYESEFILGYWKVAYGYYPVSVKGTEGMYAKHCFIVNQNNEVIDPTVILQEWRDLNDNADYISHTIFGFVDYVDALLKENGQPALYSYLYKTELNEMMPWAKENGIILMG